MQNQVDPHLKLTPGIDPIDKPESIDPWNPSDLVVCGGFLHFVHSGGGMEEGIQALFGKKNTTEIL